MTPEQNKIVYRAIKTFGGRNQTMQTIEELMELQHALFENVHRGANNRDNIIEEVADVELMLSQIKQIYNINQDQINRVIDYKTQRLSHTIDKYLAKHQEDTKSTERPSFIQIDRETSNGR